LISRAIQATLKKLVEEKSLLPSEAEKAMEEIISGSAPPSVVGAFLTALRMKGETVEEIATFARVMHRFSIGVHPKVKDRLVDTCGTGGDQLKTVNVSTAAMFVAAGAGVSVAKHGNRAVSGKVGSADLLEAIGARIDLTSEEVERCIETTGIGFMFAPIFHPAMSRIASVRKELGFRTVFNILGPLTNPADVDAQLIGVYSAGMVDKVASVLRELGRRRAMVVYGLDGIDEISVTGETLVSEIRDGAVSSYLMRPEDFKIKRSLPEEIRGGDLRRNVECFLRALSGERGPVRDIILLNAGATIFLGEKAADMEEGVMLAADSIDSGKAYRKMVEFIKATGGTLEKLEGWRRGCEFF